MAEQDSSESSTTKKSTTTKSSTKKAPAKKSTAKKSSRSSSGSSARAPRAEASRKPTAASIALQATRQFAELAGKDVEGVAGLRRTDDGWVVVLDVVELRRIPQTTDVLAGYEITVDSSGDLQEYRRTHRYVRGQVEEGS